MIWNSCLVTVPQISFLNLHLNRWENLEIIFYFLRIFSIFFQYRMFPAFVIFRTFKLFLILGTPGIKHKIIYSEALKKNSGHSKHIWVTAKFLSHWWQILEDGVFCLCEVLSDVLVIVISEYGICFWCCNKFCV